MNAKPRSNVKALPTENEKLDWAIVTPTATPVMKAHINYLNEHRIPTIWDMGQASAYLSGQDIGWFLEHVDVLTLSSYEWDVLKQKTGLDIKSVAQKLTATIITKGDKGALLYANGDSDYFPALTLNGPTYPVGCGDAFRGGLLRGLTLRWDWTDTLHLATLMGAIKAQSPEAQGYSVTTDEIARRFERAFGKTVNLKD